MNLQVFTAILAIASLFNSCGFKFKDKSAPTPSMDLVYRRLAGDHYTQGKTWRPIANAYALGIGDKDSREPNIFNFPEGITSNITPWVNGLLQNRYTFLQSSNRFIPKNHITTTSHQFGHKYFGTSPSLFADLIVQDPNLKEAQFELKNENNNIGTGYTLAITNGSYMGRFDHRYKYQIMSITEDTLKLRHLFSDNPDADPNLDEYVWYSTYVSNDITDPAPEIDPIYKILTDNNNILGKIWRPITKAYELGSGPKESTRPDYFNFTDSISYNAWYKGTLQNKFTFKGIGSKFIPENSQMTATGAYARKYFGINIPDSENAAIFDPNLKPSTFKLTKDNNNIGIGYTLEIKGKSYLGRFDKTNKYQIISITKDTLRLRHLYNEDPDATLDNNPSAWYSIYVSNDVSDDNTPLNQAYRLLTGTDPNIGKTWRPTAGPFELGIGSGSSLVPDYYDFPEGATASFWQEGTLQNRFTFISYGSKFIPKNKSATAHWAYANKYFGFQQPQFEDAAIIDQNLRASNFYIKKEINGIGTGYTIEITNGSYMGRFDMRNKYQIMYINNDTLKLRHLFSDDPNAAHELDDVAWYSTYVRE